VKPVTDERTGTGSGPTADEINLRYSGGYRRSVGSAELARESGVIELVDSRISARRICGSCVARGRIGTVGKGCETKPGVGDRVRELNCWSGLPDRDLSYANLDCAKLRREFRVGRRRGYAVKFGHADLLRAELSTPICGT